MTKEPMDDAHVLIPDELAKTIPKLYETQQEPDPLIHVKFFTPDSSWTWLATEYDPEDRLCFGFVIGFERDLHFKPKPLSECT